ncbi:MAG TPA: MaoC family dehydratase [Candidatus Rifleibacterium sp.]|nr:MaoC family dehydratase [Candidatus Rifleibacterium sp.]HPT46294.1 MaoC family dehydratase [Candidatus Rifleibacterium sp.]
MQENNGFTFESLQTGMSAEFSKTITETDIVIFAGISGDFNPVHINEEFAKKTRFEGRIAHGMLSASFISTVLGTRLPGPGCIYVSQTLKFKAPVRIGDTVTARVEVADLNAEKCFVTMKTVCLVGDKTVIEGEAVLKVPRRETSAKEH